MATVPEAEVRDLALRLARASTPSLGRRLAEAVSPTAVAMRWATGDDAFKTNLFRFVDVVPACHGPADTAEHLREYLDHPGSPRSVRTGLHVAARLPSGDRLASAVARAGIRAMARQFIIGSDLDEVVAALGDAWRRGFASTLDLLGEKTVTLAEADGYARRILAALEAYGAAADGWPDRSVLEHDPYGPVPRVNLSVKPTALAPKMAAVSEAEGVAEAVERLEPVVEAARRLGATVHLDAQHDDAKDATLALLRELGRRHPDGPALGCVVQAYRRDAVDDLDALVHWSAETLSVPLQIRLVKGAYWDAETIDARAHGWPEPVFQHKAESDANYERCAARLVDAAGDVRPAFASHNVRSLAFAISAARAAGLGDDAFEVQVLHGMAEPLHDALRDLGLRVRVYAPMGDLLPGMSYLVRRLLENTANESFVRLRAEHADLESVIAAPDPARPADPTGPAGPRHQPDDQQVRGGSGARGGSVRWEGNSPSAEVRRPEVRRRLAAAVGRVEGGLGFDAPLLIDGREVRPREALPSVDPARLERTVCVSSVAGIGDVDRAVEVGRAAVNGDWGRASLGERAAVLRRAAELYQQRRDDLTALIAFEAGKPLAEADADVGEAVDFLRYYAAAAEALANEPLDQVPGEHNELRWRPRGVGAVIAPWNFPLAIPTGMTAGALVGGNAVVFKPAEQTPGVGVRMVQLLHEAGVPPGALAYLPGIGEVVGPALVEHPDVAFVAFTGSRAVGLDIVARAAMHRPGQACVKRVSAEMGGKNPVIVDTDADLDVAVPAIARGAFGYAGQKCSATSRVLAIGATFEPLVERLAGAVELLSLGHPTDPAVGVGPLIDADSVERLARFAEIARSEGTVVTERTDVPDGGWFVGPSLVVTDDPHARIATEEIFGPLLTVLAVPDLDAALAVANDTDYALTAGFFGRTPAHVDEVGRRLAVGNLYVNRGTTGAMVGRQPFGGHKLSGSGAKAGGRGYVEQFLVPVVVTENTQRQGFAPDLR